jgi:TFIIF-interacting CTD phosphatase-like protein
MVVSFGLHLDNGIPILDFDGHTPDDELLRLIPFLQELSKADDVRP